MKKILLTAAAIAMLAGQGMSQRVMDRLDRGVVAVTTTNGVFVSWRVQGEDGDEVKFNVYRDGTLLNASPLTVSNYTDGSGSAQNTYTVKTVENGAETSTSKAAQPLSQNYLEIKIAAVPSNADGTDISSLYEPNDATVADLDGDGEMEVLLKLVNTKFHSESFPINSTDYDIIQVYKLDGRLMWWIDCGRNMVDFQSNEINIAAYDWDMDGKAECVLRGADGMVIHKADGSKHVIGDPTVNTLADLQSGMAEKFTHSGAEYLLYLNGETGEPYVVTDYPLPRLEKGETSLDDAWGDSYGHRSSKHFFGAPYLNGRTPSIFLARGIYTRHKMVAYDVDPLTHTLKERWRWANNTAGSPWYGQGYHNYTIADVDWDGRDEIVFGSMVIDDNGRGLSTTGLGHGDSHHVGHFNPWLYGQQFVGCNEDRPCNNYRDLTTSQIFYRKVGTSDDGRAIAGNFSNKYPGAQFITSKDSETLISTVINDHIPGAGGTNNVAQNFRIYWDGDLLDETFNYANGKNTAGTVYKLGTGVVESFTGTMTNNDTKGTPCFQGDIFGDWREEVIMRASDNRSIRIYTTTIPTEHRLYTLLHDPQYRNAMVWQMNGYNQTPHPSFFVGELEGITQAPPAPTMTGREELMPGGSVSGSGKSYVMAHTGDATASVAEGASPKLFVDNAPSWVQGSDNNDNIKYEYYTHTLTGGGFAGDMKLVKLGAGTLVLPAVKQKYTGNTEVWLGTLEFDGEMEQSHVWVNRLSGLQTNGGVFKQGVTAEYGSTIGIGSDSKAGSLTTTELALNFGARVKLDLFADGSCDKINSTTLKIEKKDWNYGPKYSTPVIEIVAHYAAGESKIAAGEYNLGSYGTIEGNLSDIVIEGLQGQKATLTAKDGSLILEVSGARDATDIVWVGSAGSDWDLDESENFVLRSSGEATTFVAGDRVIFDDNAVVTEINIPETLYPSAVVFNNSEKDITINGKGFEGECTIEKRGTATATLNNSSTFTGSITIDNGTLAVSSLGANEGSATGSLGHYTNPITLNGGGMLATSYTGKMSHPLTATEGGISVAKSTTLTLSGTKVVGGGIFVKGGDGQLNFSTGNTLSQLRIDGGTVYDEGDSHKLATTVVFNGKGVTLIDLNSTGSYSSDATQYVVPEGKTGKLSLDGRCNYTGSLTGSGTLEVYAPWIRTELRGDWSAFEGTIQATQETNVNSTVNKYGSSFDWKNTKGLPKATLQVKSGCTFNSSGIQLGGLTGTGTLGGSGTYTIGLNDKDGAFQGKFGSGISVVKRGTGTAYLTEVNEDAALFNIESGKVELRRTNASETRGMLGANSLTVKESGTLAGCGSSTNSSATFRSGATLSPSSYSSRSTYRSISFANDLYLQPGSIVNLEILANNNYSSFSVAGSLQHDAKVIVTLNSAYKPAIGDELTLWTAGSAQGTPELILPELPAGMYWDVRDVTPMSGVLKISDNASGVADLNADKTVMCMAVTLDGKIVKEFTTTVSGVEAACQDLTPGIYIVKMAGEGFTSSKKIAVK